MEENRDLLSYLREQAGHGVKDSEGEFSISLEAARSKLARFALPRPEAWVLKLIQAAVGWRMTRVEITQSWRETKFYLPPSDPADLPTEKEVLAALMSGQVLPDSPLANFCLALRAVVEQARLSFLLIINRGQLEFKPLYAGSYFGRLSEARRLARSHKEGLGLTLTVRHNFNLKSNTPLSQFVGLESTGLPILREVDEYAYLCPIPIVVNGTPSGGLLESPVFRFEWQKPLALSGLRDLQHSPELLALPESFERKQLSFQTARGRASRRYTGERDFACVYSLSALNRSSLTGYKGWLSSMNWVRDGVLVQGTSLPFQSRTLGIQIYANARGLPTDLTGFQLLQKREFLLRQCEVYERLADELMAWLDHLGAFFREDRDEHSDRDDRRERLTNVRKKGPPVLGVTTVGLFMSLASPMVFLPATLAGVGAIVLNKSETQKVVLHREKVSAALAEDLENVSHGFKEMAREIAAQLPYMN